MTLSSFDRRLLEEGLEYFARPRLASLLEMLGTSDRDRLDVLVTMLRHAPAPEFEEAVDLFERATARSARQRAWDVDHERVEEPRRRRASPSAERRAQRRRST
ncbi:MAG TPA: hypothetical protein VEG38_12230 [Acidimicrobiia bacterium]|nr:hypothetical protein [Acidimicrobiia bacterium]